MTQFTRDVTLTADRVQALEEELEEARAYACRLLDRIVALGKELEHTRIALTVYQEREE